MTLDDFSIKNGLQPRPSSSNGLWLLFLLPTAIITSAFKYSIAISQAYKISSILSINMTIISISIIYYKHYNRKIRLSNVWNILAAIITGILFRVCLRKSLVFCSFASGFSTFTYVVFYKFVLKKFKECFTLGEAGVVSQASALLVFFTISNVLNYGLSGSPFKSNMQISTLIIELGLAGVGLIAFTCYYFKITNARSFYCVSIIQIFTVIIGPLHVLLETSPVLWIINQMFNDRSTIKLILYWVFCTSIAVLAVSNQIFYARKASTGHRKIFHFLAVIVYVPGLIYRCSFLYLASGVVLGIILALEIIRNLRIPPLGVHLQDGFVVFSDEKDREQLAVTPIYLLTGCSLPMWIHPHPCDLTDSATFDLLPLLSGLMSIGVGDTMASIVGSNFGRFKWPGSKKTIEGTLACVFSQIGLVYLLLYFNLIQSLSTYDSVKLFAAIGITSLIEAKTSQVDNLVLPLVMYIILIM
ncbi:unnamed protein product [Phyllotreta striolata]|uniref:dolichol kinase n=1 Tax=Phyllotreta striolata TaxID=444603 RepID=A0A9N9TMI0_PHYSR|nr:unnamed protein product [Phyllotreta striolata]